MKQELYHELKLFRKDATYNPKYDIEFNEEPQVEDNYDFYREKRDIEFNFGGHEKIELDMFTRTLNKSTGYAMKFTNLILAICRM